MRGKDDYLEGKVKPRENISYFEIGETMFRADEKEPEDKESLEDG